MTRSSFRFATEPTEIARIKKRQELLSSLRSSSTSHLSAFHFDGEKAGTKNCENLIGSVEVPVGVAGPVSLQSTLFESNEVILIPLATSEGALVASVNRGCKVLDLAGGATTFSRRIGMTRAPVFQLADGSLATKFMEWLDQQFEKIKKVTESTSHHLSLESYQSWQRGRKVYTRFVFHTDEAMGMNMVTIALDTVWRKLISQFQGVELISLSSNVCADKKDSVINRLLGRGYWSQAEVFLSEKIINQQLSVESERLVAVHQAKNLVGSNLAGSFSQNMQHANVIAALFLATGQDMAHVIEGSQGSTTIEKTADGVYCAVTLPNLNLGTVGGGTWLESQSEARDIIRENGKITAQQLSEVMAVACLAGEISGLAALSNNTLASAHGRLAR